MARRTKSTAEMHAIREELLRPSRWLGHEHNTLAIHLIERGAHEIAEAELRRAIWLNPYNAVFKANLAHCLLKQHKRAEARRWALSAVASDPGNEELAHLLAPIIEAVRD